MLLFSILLILILAIVIVAFLYLRYSLMVNRYRSYWENVLKKMGNTYLSLGDSAAISVGASDPQKGYVGLIASLP